MDGFQGNREVIPRFFGKKSVTYITGREDITTSLTLLYRNSMEHQGGANCAFWADIDINRKPGLELFVRKPSESLQRYLQVSWEPGYFVATSLNPLAFGGLFDRVQGEVDAFISLLSRENSPANEHSIRRCIYDLQDKVVRDFDYPEFFDRFKR